MTENKIIKNLLEDCQDYQRRVNEIEAILLEYHNVNIEEKYWLEKYDLIRGDIHYVGRRI